MRIDSGKLRVLSSAEIHGLSQLLVLVFMLMHQSPHVAGEVRDTQVNVVEYLARPDVPQEMLETTNKI